MVRNHLSRLNAPKSWPVRRKGIKFIKRPSPGAHPLRKCIPLSLVLISLLKIVRTNKEVKRVLHERNILINGVVCTDPALPIGVMDLVSVPVLKESFRVLYTTKGNFALEKVGEKGADVRMVKIANKTLLKGGKVQLNYSDGTNSLVSKDSYKVEDTLLISIKDKAVKKHVPLKEGSMVYLTGGKRVGVVAKLETIANKQIILKIGEGSFETAKRYAFAVDGVEGFKLK